MALQQGKSISLECWYCPIFHRDIDQGLCWEISNIGNDSLGLHDDEYPSCGWDKAHEICQKCQHYADWDA